MARTALDNFDIQKMVCLDVDKEMLEKAERFCDDGKVEFLQCDVREILYQEMFDIVTAVQVNHYFKKEERVAAIKNYFPMSISESVELLKNCGFRMVEILWVSYMQVGILARK